MSQQDLIEAYGDDATRLRREMERNDAFADAISSFWHSFAPLIKWADADAFQMQAAAHLVTLREDHDVIRERERTLLGCVKPKREWIPPTLRAKTPKPTT